MGVPQFFTGQAVIESSNHTLMSDYKIKRKNKVPQRQNKQCSLKFKFLNVNEKEITAAQRHGVIEKPVALNQPIYYKGMLTSE